MLYRYRDTLTVLVLLAYAAGLWLVLADFFVSTMLGRRVLGGAAEVLGFFPVVDHTVRGTMGLWPNSAGVYGLMLGVSMAVFFLTQGVFLRPRRGMAVSLARSDESGYAAAAAAGLMLGLWVVGAAASGLQLVGLWGKPGTRPDGWVWIGRPMRDLGLMPAAFVALPLLALAWPMGTLLIRRLWRSGTRYERRLHTLFALFTLGGLMTFISGKRMLVELERQNPLAPFSGQWWESGHFTAAVLGATVAAWCAGPALTLLYATQTYRRLRRGLCIACGYDLSASPSDRCPECGLTPQPVVPG